MAVIEKVHAREIFDSRGNPTVEVDVTTKDGLFRAAVPSGASTSVYEAVELRDGDVKNDPSIDTERCMGKGVKKAVKNVNEIIGPAIKGMDVTNQTLIDDKMIKELDGVQNEWGYTKGKLGANAILGVSMAVCRAGAAAKSMPPLYKHLAELAGKGTESFVMPCPSFNVINGGSHAGNRLAPQEFMIMPVGAKSFAHALEIGSEVYHTLKKVIKSKYGQDACNVGDEGGFAPNVQSSFEALDLLLEAIQQSGHKGKVKIACDPAASEFFAGNGTYDLDFKNKGNQNYDAQSVITREQMLEMYQQWFEKYPLVSLEDPFDENDWDGYCMAMKSLGNTHQIMGDDNLSTNPKRIEVAMQKGACNCLLLKLNQIGSVTETITAANMCRNADWGVMVSHRSGETEDSFIGDLVVGLGLGQIKSGAPCRGERLAKYNQMLRIEEQLGDSCSFAGVDFRDPKINGSLGFAVLTRRREVSKKSLVPLDYLKL